MNREKHDLQIHVKLTKKEGEMLSRLVEMNHVITGTISMSQMVRTAIRFLYAAKMSKIAKIKKDCDNV